MVKESKMWLQQVCVDKILGIKYERESCVYIYIVLTLCVAMCSWGLVFKCDFMTTT